MIALPSLSPSPSQPLFPTLAWSFESSPYHQHHESTQTFVLGSDFNDHHHLLQLPQQMLLLGHEIPAATSTTHDTSNNGDSTTVVKKLHHNASERDRRKKMNTLYSSLRSLLPVPDQMKKLSIPSTVARVVKYIPELQQEVQKLITKKEKLLSKMAKQEVHDNLKIHQQKQSKNVSMSTISLNRLGNGDVVIQIPAQKGQDCPLMSELLLNLEEEGLLLLNASSVESSGGTLLFYNFHFKVKENYRLDREKVISMLGKKDQRVFPRDIVGIMQQLDHH